MRESESEAAQSRPTLSDPMDCSLPGSSHGIFQARVLEWVAIAFSREKLDTLSQNQEKISKVSESPLNPSIQHENYRF